MVTSEDSGTAQRDAREWDTSSHLERARSGDRQSLAWIVKRLSPLLLAQARYRVGPHLRRHVDPADLVDEAWLVALPRLGDLQAESGRTAAVLLRFLSTTLLHQVNNLSRKVLRRRLGTTGQDGQFALNGPAPAEELPAEVTGVVTRACRDERKGQVSAALEEMGERDREILVLRGIEQSSNQSVAGLLGITPQAASQRYHRALERLRKRLPSSIFEDLPEEE
jgi:RNA polymerase sigma-70 factor (ECF subfamily)